MISALFQHMGIGSSPRRRSKIVPRPEPPLRPLLLSERTFMEAPQGDVTVHFQEQSALISRIPVELRLIIWDHVLGREHENDVLHLEPSDGILRYRRCYEQDNTKLPFRHKCWRTYWTKAERDGGNWVPWEPVDARKLCSVILVCKLIHNEATDILYSSNTFDMRRIESLIRLPKIILPQRFEHIRRVRFSTAFHCPIRMSSSKTSKRFPPEDPARWPAACEVLASLDCLETLEITIAIWSKNQFRRDGADDDSLLALLQPLKAAKASEYTVTITENLPDNVRTLLGVTPYSIVRRERTGIGLYRHPSDD